MKHPILNFVSSLTNNFRYIEQLLLLLLDRSDNKPSLCGGNLTSMLIYVP